MDQYQGIKYNVHATPYIIVVAVFGTLAVIAVILRFVSRSKTKANYGADDWFALVALAGFLGFSGVILWAAQNGSGYNPAALPLPVLRVWLKTAYISSVLSPIPPAFGRFSVLSLYTRMFSIHGRFRVAVRIVFIVNTLWYIGVTIALIFACVPIHSYWDAFLRGKCIKLDTFAIAAEIPDSLLDFIIVGLPLGVLKNLRLPLRHKIPLSCIFVLGGFVGVIGFIRIIITYKPQNYSYSAGSLWLVVQLGISVVCCCLPTYRPLLPRFDSLNSLRSRLTTTFLRTRTRTPASSNTPRQDGSPAASSAEAGRYIYHQYMNLGDGASSKAIIIEGDAGRSANDRADKFPQDSIHVQRSVDIV